MASLLGSSRGGTGRPLTAGYPATTATSLASVGTGLPPGAHGLPGYTVRNPATGELMNQLRWQPWTTPQVWQPYPTVFQLAHAAGVHAAQVSSPDLREHPADQGRAQRRQVPRAAVRRGAHGPRGRATGRR